MAFLIRLLNIAGTGPILGVLLIVMAGDVIGGLLTWFAISLGATGIWR